MVPGAAGRAGKRSGTALLSALNIALAIQLLFAHGPNTREDDISTVAPEVAVLVGS
jgi:hypothetical protein